MCEAACLGNPVLRILDIPFAASLPEAVLTRAPAVLAACAAVMGAAGVGLAALAAHQNGGEFGRTAALFLILHAGALMGVSAHARIAPSPALLVAGFVTAAGAALFSADLARIAFAGERLFPLAAPLGGSTMILGWLALALVFLASARR